MIKKRKGENVIFTLHFNGFKFYLISAIPSSLPEERKMKMEWKCNIKNYECLLSYRNPK